jgi:ATP-dependent DNA helicase RecG
MLRSRTRRRGGKLTPTPEVSASALREAVVNAVVHRDYTLAGRTDRVLIFADRVEVRSPGRPPNSMTVQRMVAGLASMPRNPRIFTIMAHLEYVQNLGMGVRTIVEETTRLKQPAVVEVEGDETTVRFPRAG